MNMSDNSALVRTTLPSSVRLEDDGGLPRLSVRSPCGTADVYFQGAHVAAWHPAGTRAAVLWTSSKSAFEPGRAIRGGVPICFPWFGPGEASAPLHGFARVRPWTLVEAREDAAGAVILEMQLEGSALSPQWPHRFFVTHRISFGAALRMELVVHNPGAEPFTFEEALHSYFGVGDIRSVTVAGLERTDYLDKVGGLARRRQGDEPVSFTGETDRVYLDTRTSCRLLDPAGRREITVTKAGSDATVVWNPWIDKARAMADFGDDEWRKMVCLETCNANVHAVRLAPGESHTMTALIEVRDEMSPEESV